MYQFLPNRKYRVNGKDFLCTRRSIKLLKSEEGESVDALTVSFTDNISTYFGIVYSGSSTEFVDVSENTRIYAEDEIPDFKIGDKFKDIYGDTIVITDIEPKYYHCKGGLISIFHFNSPYTKNLIKI